MPENNFLVDEDKKIFLREQIRLELGLKNAKQLCQQGDKIIVMIHYPPFNSLYQNGYTTLLEQYGLELERNYSLLPHSQNQQKV